MSGVEKITGKILSSAQDSADEILSEARAEATSIIEKAKNEAEIQSADILEKAGKDAEEIVKRRISVAELECRKRTLSAKQEMVEAAFAEAEKKLTSMPKDKYLDFLAGLLEKNAAGGEEIVLNSKDKDELGLKLVAHVLIQNAKALKLSMPKISDDTANINGGFILRKGNIEYNSSLSTILNSNREDLLPMVAAKLFD